MQRIVTMKTTLTLMMRKENMNLLMISYTVPLERFIAWRKAFVQPNVAKMSTEIISPIRFGKTKR